METMTLERTNGVQDHVETLVLTILDIDRENPNRQTRELLTDLGSEIADLLEEFPEEVDPAISAEGLNVSNEAILSGLTRDRFVIETGITESDIPL